MKPNYSRYRPRYSADYVMEVACKGFCKHYAEWENDKDYPRLGSHCKECRLKLLVHLSVPK